MSRSNAHRRSAAVFSALGDETRLRLVARMCNRGPTSIASLTDGAGITRQAVTKHLRVLETAGLVATTRVGREAHWQLLPGGLDAARSRLDRIAAQWDDALMRLKAHVEKKSRR